MSNLKDQLIKLGSEEPELQDHIRPVLDHLESSHKTARASKEFEDSYMEMERHLDKLNDIVRTYKDKVQSRKEKKALEDVREEIDEIRSIMATLTLTKRGIVMNDHWIVALDEKGWYAHGPFRTEEAARRHMEPLSHEVEKWHVVNEGERLDRIEEKAIEEAKEDRSSGYVEACARCGKEIEWS